METVTRNSWAKLSRFENGRLAILRGWGSPQQPWGKYNEILLNVDRKPQEENFWMSVLWISPFLLWTQISKLTPRLLGASCQLKTTLPIPHIVFNHPIVSFSILHAWQILSFYCFPSWSCFSYTKWEQIRVAKWEKYQQVETPLVIRGKITTGKG